MQSERISKVSSSLVVRAMASVRDNQESLNAAQYKELMDEIGLVKLPEGLKDQTDWKDEVFRTGNVQDYQLSITNGTDKLRYFISSASNNTWFDRST